MKLVDLSYEFYPGMSPIKGYAESDVQISALRTVEKDGVNMMQISFRNHVGTHIDGPRHIIPGAELLDELPLESFYGTGVVLDVPKGPDEPITRNDLQSAQPPVQNGDVVLIHTRQESEFGSKEYFEHHAYLTEDGARFLAEKKVRLVGIDVISIDVPHSLRGKGFKHASLHVLLQNKIPVIHSLGNLESLAGKRVTVAAFPIRFRGADSAPARVVALVD